MKTWFYPTLLLLTWQALPAARAADAAFPPAPAAWQKNVGGFGWSPDLQTRLSVGQEKDIPNDPFGDMVRLGRDIFLDTRAHAGQYMGQDNALACVNCHLGAGRKADSAPLWAARPMYPAYSEKSGKVVTLVERMQRCFVNALGGSTPPPVDSREMTALVAYSHWLATGLPTGVTQPGRNYPRLDKPAQGYDPARGKAVYAEHCQVCHGADGAGLTQNGRWVFPPLWGKRSYTWGADMQRIDLAAGFIHANMPLGKPSSLSVQQAWDVAAYINSQERPQDPRYSGSIAATAEQFHKDEESYYGKEIGGVQLGRGLAE